MLTMVASTRIIDGTTVNTTINSYTISCLPEDDDEASSWVVTVEYRGRGLWAVKHGAMCLSKSGDWDFEMRPSSREDDWLAEHRFDLDTALRIAQEAAPGITVNGFTPGALLAWRKQRRAERESQ